MDWDGPPPRQALCCRCRPLAFTRALDNLVDNAVRYGHRARVRLQREDDWLHIDVSDIGPGIAPDQREAAFAPFARLAPEKADPDDGCGLGLALARSFARAHGGDATLHDGPGGRGLRARLTLPA